ncbi:MAG: ribbon-helix-helix domain-containing protein [Dehalococcoidia bacterium]
MGRSVKVAISMPEEELKIADRECKARDLSRSEFFRQAIQSLLRREQERIDVERYIQAYRDQPETAEEIAAAEQTSLAVLAQEPWE